MARKSRKNVDKSTINEIQVAKKPTFNVGAYIRLSAVDRKQKGDSIETQQAIIKAFLSEKDLELTETYIDNGLSGQSFERPAFQRMIADIESGQINLVITKDLSRLGRNAIDTGFYIEKFFPVKGVRFIAITDDYDSADGNSGGIMLSLKNMVNETYALEIGRKIRATKQMNIKNGCFVGKFAPYGLLRMEDDKHKLFVDSYAGNIVRHMFEMTAEGQGVTAIADWLNENGVLPPKPYFCSIGLIGEKEVTNSSIYWNKGIIHTILANRMYVGDMVQGKGKTHSYNLTRVPKEKWVITENTHEAIVSHELFDKVQSIKENNTTNKKRHGKTLEDLKAGNPFLRKIYCGHCGRPMFKRNTGSKGIRFTCNTQNMWSKEDCVPNAIYENDIREFLLDSIQQYAKEAGEFNGSVTKINLASQQKSNGVDVYNSELKNVQSEIDRNSNFLKGLYESLVVGDITESEYKEMKGDYEAKLTVLHKQEKHLREKSLKQTLSENSRLKVNDSVQSVQTVSDITAEIIDGLIERIQAFDNGQIAVKFKFMEEVIYNKELVLCQKKTEVMIK